MQKAYRPQEQNTFSKTKEIHGRSAVSIWPPAEMFCRPIQCFPKFELDARSKNLETSPRFTDVLKNQKIWQHRSPGPAKTTTVGAELQLLGEDSAVSSLLPLHLTATLIRPVPWSAWLFLAFEFSDSAPNKSNLKYLVWSMPNGISVSSQEQLPVCSLLVFHFQC